MHLIYCTYGREMGKKEAPTPPEQLEKYTEVQLEAKHGI